MSNPTGRAVQPCGTRAAWARGCRCEACTAASRAYHRQIRQGIIPDTQIPAGPPPPGAWVQRAACRGSDVEAFFPTRGANVAHLRLICGACPVRPECLTWAVDSFSDHADHGFYGGCSPKERRDIRRGAL